MVSRIRGIRQRSQEQAFRMPSRTGGSRKWSWLGKRLRCPGKGWKAKAGVLVWIFYQKLTMKQGLGGAENTSRDGKVADKGVSPNQLSRGVTRAQWLVLWGLYKITSWSYPSWGVRGVRIYIPSSVPSSWLLAALQPAFCSQSTLLPLFQRKLSNEEVQGLAIGNQ